MPGWQRASTGARSTVGGLFLHFSTSQPSISCPVTLQKEQIAEIPLTTFTAELIGFRSKTEQLIPIPTPHQKKKKENSGQLKPNKVPSGECSETVTRPSWHCQGGALSGGGVSR